MKNKFLIGICTIFLVAIFFVGSVSAADYKFQNATGTNLIIIHGDTGNLTVIGNISASSGFFTWLGDITSRITKLFVTDADISNNLSVGGNLSVDTNTLFVNSNTDRVGIGTATPQNLLNVDGDANITGTLFAEGGGTMTGQFDFNGGWTNGGLSIDGGDLYTKRLFVVNISGLNITTLSINGSLLPDLDNQFDLGNSTFRWKDLALGGEISSDGTGDSYFLGSLGIGTATPQNTLNVVGDLNVTGTIYGSEGNITDTYVPYTGATKNVDLGANNFSVDTSVLFVDSNNDRVGIGTTSPGAELEVNGAIKITPITDGDPQLVLALSNGGEVATFRVDNTGKIYFNPLDVDRAFRLSHKTSGIGGLSIEVDGKVGIASGDFFTPAAQLHVGKKSSNTIQFIVEGYDGGQTADLIQWRNGVTGAILGVINASGSMGINTSTPQNILNVVGDANITGAFYVLNSKCASGDVLTADTTTGLISCVTDQIGGGGLAADGTYLYNDSTTMYFNTTLAGTDLSVNSSNYWDGYDTPSGWDLDSSDDLTTSTSWSGDLGGTGSSPTVINTQGLSYTNITDEPWIESASEGNLNVNSSNYWDGLNTPSDISTGDLTDDGTFYLKSDPFGFYNSTDFVITDYYLKSNPFSFYNTTTIPSYILTSNEGNLNVNSSDFWDGYDTPSGWDLDSSDDLTTSTSWSGDLGGTGSSPTVDNTKCTTDQVLEGDGTCVTNYEVGDDGDTSSSNELQNLWYNITGDSGSTVANSQTDIFTIAGGGTVSTAISGDTVTITGSAHDGTGTDDQTFAEIGAGTATVAFLMGTGGSLGTSGSGTISATDVEGTDLGTLTNGYYCTYDSTGTEIDCNTQYTVATDTDCAATSVLMGDGTCDTKTSFGDGTGTDDQTLSEVLAQGADANNLEIVNVNGIRFGSASSPGSWQIYLSGTGYVADYLRADGGLTTDSTDPGTGNIRAGGTLTVVGAADLASFDDEATKLGKTGAVSLDTVTNTAAEWSNLPVGYSRMFINTIGTAGGAPVDNYGYFTKVGNRDTAGGWGGIWAGYNDGENYMGRASTSSVFATWDKLWSDANDGSGSGLDADTLDTLDSTAFYLASNPSGYTTNTGTVTSVTGSAPITSTGGTTPDIGLTLLKDLVAGTGIGGGADNVLPGADSDVTLTVAGGTCLTASADGLDVDNLCVNAATTDGFSLGETMGNCGSAQVHKGDGACENEASLSVSYATTSGGSPPTGTASGDLSGSYPSPQVVDDSHNHIYSNIDATTSANWNTRVSDNTGSGLWVFGTSPTLTTPILTGEYNTISVRGGSTSSGLKLSGSDGIADGYLYATTTEVGLLDDDGSWAVRVDTDNIVEFRVNNAIEGTFASTGLTITDDLVVSGGDISITNNNGGINFNDASAYWLKTATNWGLYWDTTANTLEFTGAGTSRVEIDLDNGNIQMDGDLTVSGGDITGANNIVIRPGSTNDRVIFEDTTSGLGANEGQQLDIVFDTTYVQLVATDKEGDAELLQIPNGLYVSGSTAYFTNQLQARGGIQDDGGNLVLNDKVDITGDLDVAGGDIFDDGANFFGTSGCGANTGVSSMSSAGTITCTADSASDNYGSWTLTGDSGTSQTISSGNTADIAGGTAISTVVGATDTVTVSVTGDSIGDTQLAYDTGQHLKTTSDVTFGEVYTAGAVGGVDSGIVYITKPEGAAFDGPASNTGAIQIRLPVKGPSTMMKMTVEIYDYAADESITLKIGGYAYSSTSWTNTFAQIIAGRTDRDFNVRFGYDATSSIIWIGETTSTWSYVDVVVTDFMGGHSGDTWANWADGWDITIDASFDTVVVTESANFVIAQDVVCTNCLTSTEVASADYATTAGDADTVDSLHASSFYLASNPSGYTTNTGDITGITTNSGSGLGGGCSSGTCTLTIDASDLADTTNDGITTSSENFVVQGGTCLTADSSGLNVDNLCVNAATTDGFSLGETMGNCGSAQVHKGDGGCENENALSVSYATNAGTLDGYDSEGSSTNRWGIIPLVRNSDGLMEIGKYIDFHENDNDGANDYALRITSSGDDMYINSNLVVSGGKITVTTWDPLYTIGEDRYSTYGISIVGGVKEEVTGIITLNSSNTIDFKNLEVGSDLWLFYQISDFGEQMENLQVMLTPSFDGSVWYEKNPEENTLTIIGDQAGEVSYRFTANRFDWGNWDTLYLEDDNQTGLVVPMK